MATKSRSDTVELRLDHRSPSDRRKRLQHPLWPDIRFQHGTSSRYGPTKLTGQIEHIGGGTEVSDRQDDTAITALGTLIRRGGGIDDEAKHDCLIGSGCYSTAFRISTLGCILAFALSIIAGFRRERVRRDRRLVICSHDSNLN